MRRTEDRFQGARGVAIYAQAWMPEGEPRAVLLVAHGAAEHSARYARFAEHFVQRGYGVAALDHIGHGQSGGTPGFVDDFTDYVDTLDVYCQRLQGAYPGVPLVLLGHSMGGLMSCCYLLRNQDAFIGCILSGPAIKTELEPPWWQRLLIRVFSRVLPRLGVLQLDSAGISRDLEEVRKYREDPLVYTGKLSARMVSQLFVAMGQVQERVADIRLPLLLLHGGDDAMTAPAGSQLLYDGVSSRVKTLKIYPGLFHEIFNEPERAEVFADIDTWLAQQLDPHGDEGSAVDGPTSTGTEHGD